MTKATRLIYNHKPAIRNAARIIKTIDLPISLNNNKIHADLIGAIMLDELQRRDWLDLLQDVEARLITSQYGSTITKIEQRILSKVLKPIAEISLGPAQMKCFVVAELVQEQLITKPPNWENNQLSISIKWLLDPQKSAELIGARLEQTVRYWAKNSVDISSQPAILATLYSIGLVSNAGVHHNPTASKRGERINHELRKIVQKILESEY